MTPRPIHSEEDYKLALAEVDRLWRAEPGSRDEADLELWGMAIDAYEAATMGSSKLDPVEVVRAEMEMNGRSRADLAGIIGENRATEILARQRALTLPMIRRISAAWNIPADLLIGEYGIGSRAGGTGVRPGARSRPEALKTKAG